MNSTLVEALYSSLAEVSTVEALHQCAEEFTKLADHEHFICDFFSRDRAAFLPLTIHNYSQLWLDRASLVPKALYDRDPVFAHLDTSPLPLVWSRVNYEAADVTQVWEEASAAGIGAGVAVSVQCAQGIVLRVGMSRDARSATQHLEAVTHKAHVLLFATCLKAKAGDILVPKPPVDAPHLTGRELDALKWTRAGKTAWELGQILGISYATVNFHLQNAQRKLTSFDKHQAVLRAIELHLID